MGAEAVPDALDRRHRMARPGESAVRRCPRRLALQAVGFRRGWQRAVAWASEREPSLAKVGISDCADHEHHRRGDYESKEHRVKRISPGNFTAQNMRFTSRLVVQRSCTHGGPRREFESVNPLR